MENLVFRVVGRQSLDYLSCEAEGHGYMRLPERITDIDGAPIHLANTLHDWRNWRGVRGQKMQAVLFHVLAQLNAGRQSTSRRLVLIGPISKRGIAQATGLDTRTVDSALDGLARAGILSVTVTGTNPRELRYEVAVRLPVSGWNLPHIHRWGPARVAGCPF